jgi:hypothetical protein
MHDSFRILEQMFTQLLFEMSLYIFLLLDIVMCCCMLHNLITNGKDEDIT